MATLALGKYFFEVDPDEFSETWMPRVSSQKGVGQVGEDLDFCGMQREISFIGTLLNLEIASGDLLDIEDELRSVNSIQLIDPHGTSRQVKVINLKMIRKGERNVFEIMTHEVPEVLAMERHRLGMRIPAL